MDEIIRYSNNNQLYIYKYIYKYVYIYVTSVHTHEIPIPKSFQWEHHPRTREKNVVFDGRRQEEVPNPLRMGYPTTHGFGQFYGSESSIFDFGG